MNWKKQFVKKFYIYNLETGTPAGAEKEAVEFIQGLLDQKDLEFLNILGSIPIYWPSVESDLYDSGCIDTINRIKEKL